MLGKVTIFVFMLVALAITIDPPVWPDHFSQNFVQTYSYTSLHTTGSMYYDFTKNRLRVDRDDGRFQTMCASVMNSNVQTKCTQLVRDDSLYMIYPQKRYCCMCCNAAHGCGVMARDWLKQATYEGQQSLSGQSFNKWSIPKSTITVNYYARKDAKNTPRQINDGNIKIIDYIMNSYSQVQTPDSYFELPSYCTDACPSKTVCGQLRSNPLLTIQ